MRDWFRIVSVESRQIACAHETPIRIKAFITFNRDAEYRQLDNVVRTDRESL
jgi:hypothetical protein